MLRFPRPVLDRPLDRAEGLRRAAQDVRLQRPECRWRLGGVNYRVAVVGAGTGSWSGSA
jgi:hypothetical protein